MRKAFAICLRGLAAALVVAAWSGSATASEPVSRDDILGRLVAITGEESGRSIDLDIRFELNSAGLTAEAKAQLDELGHALTAPQLAGAQIGVYGHTDASGPADYNQRLSEERADAVVAYLVETFEIDPKRLAAAGYGEEKPKNLKDATAPENRRVQIVNLSPLPGMAVEPPQKSAPAMPAPSEAVPAPSSEGGMQSIQ